MSYTTIMKHELKKTLVMDICFYNLKNKDN